jgi:hypothetical protein
VRELKGEKVNLVRSERRNILERGNSHIKTLWKKELRF